ncbi:MAG: aminoacyl-tRNA hydrolase [Bdellovibrionales bacterium]|nr:aminoacyl-tRNA hydrolase [Bdellovibrionales bacterium]
MWLIVGLGNPGNKYALTRHNIGFMLIDALVRSNGNPHERSEQKALTYHFTLTDQDTRKSEKVILCKPQTFMNLSGDSVRGLVDFYKIDLDKILVAHDEVDQPFGQLKMQKERGHGGHNGIRDTHLKLGTNKYHRLRLGVGRPSGPMDVADYVLAPFSKDEMNKLPDFLSYGIDALESLVFKGYEKTATQFNKVIQES